MGDHRRDARPEPRLKLPTIGDRGAAPAGVDIVFDGAFRGVASGEPTMDVAKPTAASVVR